MKILPVPLIREADAYTILHEPIADIDLMERAAGVCCDWLKVHLQPGCNIRVFCGSGNNGGDGFAIARMLMETGYHVEVVYLTPPEKMSENCRVNYERIRDAGYRMPDTGCRMLDAGQDIPEISQTDIVIDALFGNGLTRPVEGLASAIISHINTSGARVIAIDLPSGLFCDQSTVKAAAGSVIRADYTLTFAPPKLALFFPENDAYVGQWQLMDIGLSNEFIDSVDVGNHMLQADELSKILKHRNKFAHKGNFGHALVIAGSSGKFGAALLCARACLRSGPGLVTIRTPKSGVSILQGAVPEAMIDIDTAEDHISGLPALENYSAIACGPGLGKEAQTAITLKLLIQEATVPMVFDADAINILSENKTWLAFIPKGCIFTPHPREFERLAGKSGDDFERNRMQRDFSSRYHCYVVLKGAHSVISTPDGSCYFNTTGNPGMATGGSGDVLTGIITGLLAQGYSSPESCVLGVYLHGLAADLALGDQSFESLIAGDIVTNLGKSFQTLYGKL